MPSAIVNRQPCQEKAQPWKAHWPPVEAKEASGVEYGVEKGAVIVVDGTSAKVSPPSREASAKGAAGQK